jgi:hypothetical protein
LFSLNPNIELLSFSLKPLNDQFNMTMMITGLGLQTNKSNKRLLRAMNSLISATKSMTMTRMMANQKVRIEMMIAIAMIIAITMNKPNASSMYLETDSQPNLSISASAIHTKYTSPSPGYETSINSTKPPSSYINNSTSNLQRFNMQILD